MSSNSKGLIFLALSVPALGESVRSRSNLPKQMSSSSDSGLEFLTKVEKMLPTKNSISVQFTLSSIEQLQWEQYRGIRRALRIKEENWVRSGGCAPALSTEENGFAGKWLFLFHIKQTSNTCLIS